MESLYRWRLFGAALVVAMVGTLAVPSQTLAQPIMGEELFSETFDPASSNGNWSNVLTNSNWSDGLGNSGSHNRDDNHQNYCDGCGGGPPADIGAVGVHAGQGGRQSNEHAVTSFNLSQLPAGTALRASFVSSFAGNTFGFAPGGASMQLYVGTGTAGFGVTSGALQLIASKNGSTTDAITRLELNNQTNSELVSVDVNTVSPVQGNMSAIEIMMEMTTAGAEGFWRPISGVCTAVCDGGNEVSSTSEFVLGRARDDGTEPWTSFGTVAIGSVGLIDQVAVGSSGPINVAGIDTIFVGVTPEPASAALLALGGLALLRRRRQA
jgi:hypothetical protein